MTEPLYTPVPVEDLPEAVGMISATIESILDRLDTIEAHVGLDEPILVQTDDTELARRACVVLRQAVRDAGSQFARVDFGELNDVLYEAEKRGWLP